MEDRVVLVTGANRGIGFEICRLLALKGLKVILTSRNAEKGQVAVKRLLDEGITVTFCQLDVTDPDSIKDAFAFVKSKYGKLDVLINNAGISLENDRYITKVEIDIIKATMETNFIGPLRICQIFIPLLIKGIHPRIINVSSTLGSLHEGNSGYPAYSISKTALNALTVQLSHALAERIKVYSMCPGWVKTDMGGSNAPMTVEEGADTAVWLATEDKIPSGYFYQERHRIDW